MLHHNICTSTKKGKILESTKAIGMYKCIYYIFVFIYIISEGCQDLEEKMAEDELSIL